MRRQQTPTSARRITAYVRQHFAGNTKAAAAALDVDYTKLWRAATGTTRRGPALDILTALAKHSGERVEYWIGEVV